MNRQEYFNYIQKCGVCRTCCLRYLKARGNEYEDMTNTFKMLNIQVTRSYTQQTDSESDPEMDPDIDPSCTYRRRMRNKTCPVCLSLFCPNTLESIIENIECHPDIEKYDSDKFVIALALPMILSIRQCSMWLALIERFGDVVDDTIPPEVPIKEAAKLIMIPQLCRKLKKTYDQDGIMITVHLYHPDEEPDMKILEELDKVMFPPKRGTRPREITRSYFERTYIPSKICTETYEKYLDVPPEFPTGGINAERITFVGPTVFVAGRYRKLSRKLSHTPWILFGKRIIEHSIQEIIIENICEHFGDSRKMIFSSSGREDVDVRCLGGGRPFVIEIPDSRRTILSKELAMKIEQNIEKSIMISVNNLQIVGRDELVHIKAGEESKRKSYRALCILNKPVTVKILETLNMPNGFQTEQITPIRVLHRRPLHMRPRSIYNVKAYADRKHKNYIILDVTTQAGTYIKELVHGEFGRTKPSISSLINEWIDIVALDVIDIDINWPKNTNNETD